MESSTPSTVGESGSDETPSYHDLHITTAQIPRTSIFNLSYGLEVICNRVTGWRLYQMGATRYDEPTLIAGEFDTEEKWLVLDVAGHVITDTYGKAPE